MSIENRILIITGMHRSGTSLVSHYLKECGLHLGDNMGETHESDPLGYYEDKEFVDFHRRILYKKRLGEFSVNQLRLSIPIAESDRKEAIHLIARKMQRHQWGWKDPRTALFLDFWDSIVENARYLFLFRDPIEVFYSLLKRATDECIIKRPKIGLQSWCVYNQRILGFYAQHRDISLVWNIDEFCHDPERHLRPLRSNFALELEPCTLDGIFSKHIFHFSNSSPRMPLIKRYPLAFLEAWHLYSKLQRISV